MSRRRTPSALIFFTFLVAMWGLLPVRPALAGGLSIELNSTRNIDTDCEAAFLIRNELGHTLDRFSLDLYLFDTDGVALSRYRLNLAPLPAGRTTPATFRLGRPCAAVSRILVSDAPSCRAEDTGAELDCLSGLALISRNRLMLDK